MDKGTGELVVGVIDYVRQVSRRSSLLSQLQQPAAPAFGTKPVQCSCRPPPSPRLTPHAAWTASPVPPPHLQYTWDKQVETWVKKSGILGGAGKDPTVISPKQYSRRFRRGLAAGGLAGLAGWLALPFRSGADLRVPLPVPWGNDLTGRLQTGACCGCGD